MNLVGVLIRRLKDNSKQNSHKNKTRSKIIYCLCKNFQIILPEVVNEGLDPSEILIKWQVSIVSNKLNSCSSALVGLDILFIILNFKKDFSPSFYDTPLHIYSLIYDWRHKKKGTLTFISLLTSTYSKI